MFHKLFDFVMTHSGYVITAGVVWMEFVLRKFPGTEPLFQTISNIFDNVPGFKNKTGK